MREREWEKEKNNERKKTCEKIRREEWMEKGRNRRRVRKRRKEMV